MGQQYYRQFHTDPSEIGNSFMLGMNIRDKVDQRAKAKDLDNAREAVASQEETRKWTDPDTGEVHTQALGMAPPKDSGISASAWNDARSEAVERQGKELGLERDRLANRGAQQELDLADQKQSRLDRLKKVGGALNAFQVAAQHADLAGNQAALDQFLNLYNDNSDGGLFPDGFTADGFVNTDGSIMAYGRDKDGNVVSEYTFKNAEDLASQIRHAMVADEFQNGLLKVELKEREADAEAKVRDRYDEQKAKRDYQYGRKLSTFQTDERVRGEKEATQKKLDIADEQTRKKIAEGRAALEAIGASPEYLNVWTASVLSGKDVPTLLKETLAAQAEKKMSPEARQQAGESALGVPTRTEKKEQSLGYITDADGNIVMPIGDSKDLRGFGGQKVDRMGTAYAPGVGEILQDFQAQDSPYRFVPATDGGVSLGAVGGVKASPPSAKPAPAMAPPQIPAGNGTDMSSRDVLNYITDPSMRGKKVTLADGTTLYNINGQIVTRNAR